MVEEINERLVLMKKAKTQPAGEPRRLTIPEVMEEVEKAKAILAQMRKINAGRQPRVVLQTNRRLKELSAKGIKSFVMGYEYNTLSIVFGDNTKVVFTLSDTSEYFNYSDSLYSAEKDPVLVRMSEEERCLQKEFDEKIKLIPDYLHPKVAGL